MSKKKVSILKMIIECGKQLDLVNASDQDRSMSLTLGNYKRLCKELGVDRCARLDRFDIKVDTPSLCKTCTIASCQVRYYGTDDLQVLDCDLYTKEKQT